MVFRSGLVWFFLCLPLAAFGADNAAEPEFVDIKAADRTIVVELRYASPNNFTRRPIYPTEMPALVRPRVAERLVVAQKYLRKKGYGLKIWDAYRSSSAQKQLFQAMHHRSYVADPEGEIGSMHTRGAAVDATLVDSNGREVAMPTDFDNFTPAALLTYQGNEPQVRANLKLLQKAMAHGGFYGLRTEWWHFCAPDWKRYPPAPELRFQQSSRVPRPRDRGIRWVVERLITGSLDYASLRSG